jgi:hypothetical protein
VTGQVDGGQARRVLGASAISPTGGADLGVLALLVVSLTSYVPGLHASAWALPVVIAALVIPVGLASVVRLARERDRAAIAGILLVAWATLSALLASAKGLSMFGGLQSRSSVVTLAAAVGLFGIGRLSSARCRSSMPWVVVGVLLLSGGLAVVQVLVDPNGGQFALVDGRPPGLAGHPVFLGCQAAMVAGFFAFRSHRRVRPLDIAGLGAASAIATLSGTRAALGVLVLLSLARVARSRQVAELALVGSAALGAVLGHLLSASGTSAQSSIDRVGGSGVEDRINLWRWTLQGWWERPLQGWGLGRSLPAAQLHFSDDWAARQTIGGLFNWAEPHNLPIEVLVSLGLVGLMLAAWFGWASFSMARGPLTWVVVAAAIPWLLEPTAPVVLFPAAILLGAAGASAGVGSLAPASTRWVGVAASAVALGTAAAVPLALASITLDEAVSSPEASLAAQITRYDPSIAARVARAAYDPSAPDSADADFVLDWSRRAAEREPDNPLWWAELSLRAIGHNRLDLALDAADHGLELQPNHPLSMLARQIVAERTGDFRLVANLEERLCSVGVGRCDQARSTPSTP